MAYQQSVTYFDAGAGALYSLRIHNDGYDGGSNAFVTVGDLPNFLEQADIENALRVFGEALAPRPDTSLISITRITPAETPVAITPPETPDEPQ